MVVVHIFLVGMTGSGKRSLGQKLAASLGLPFVDTDQRVSQMMNMPVDQVVRSLGEGFFHNAETGVLMELVDALPSIVATGVGLPLLKENVQLMQNHGIIIHIDRPLDQILADRRSQAGSSFVASDQAELIAQYDSHIGYYRACADHTLDNDLGPVVGAQALLDLVRRLFPDEP